MKFSLNWLGEFVELPNDVGQLVELLTFAGVEVEGIENRGANFDNVVVAQIKSSQQHPNADRLSVCQVDDGSGEITVLARSGRGAPARGTKVQVKGRITEFAVLGGRSVGLHLQEEDRKVKS